MNQPQANPDRYSWDDHFGGLILRDRATGRKLFFQPGDDADLVRSELELALAADPDRPGLVDACASEYFACLGGDA